MADASNEHENQNPETQDPHDSGIDHLIDGDESTQEHGGEEEAPVAGLMASLDSGRSASVRFHRSVESGGSKNQFRMDAANQSLADALKITYGFLQIGMVILIILFVFSGFQKINEGERGISLFFGKPSQTNLEPGAHLTWPYPIGELVKVGGGTVEVPLARTFMPSRAGSISDDALLEVPIDQFNNSLRLNPEQDNSLITADLNIAHTQWTVNYHRSDHLKFTKNILPSEEQLVVMIAVRRGVTHTVAEITIDDLLKKSAETIASRVRASAQGMLDTLDSGITIDRVVMVRKTPPLYLLEQFASVQSSAQNAGKLKEDAMLLRDQRLNEVAGRAAPVLISMIGAYERAVELHDEKASSDLLEQIDLVLEGKETNYEGQSTLGLVTGEVSEMLNIANSSASTRVSKAIADLEQFKAKLAQFEANPKLMIARDWSSGMSEFLEKDFVTTMYLPRGVHAELVLNSDPDVDRERDRLRKRAEAAEGQRQRRADAERDFFRSQRGIKMEDEE